MIYGAIVLVRECHTLMLVIVCRRLCSASLARFVPVPYAHAVPVTNFPTHCTAPLLLTSQRKHADGDQERRARRPRQLDRLAFTCVEFRADF